jgi:hypothetical protein
MGLKFDIFENYPEVQYGISSLEENIVKAVGSDNATIETQYAYFQKFAVDSGRVVTPLLIGGVKVVVVRSEDGGKVIPDTDGLATADKNLFLSITAADCFPLYFYDPGKEIVALIHAGWKGVAKGIVAEAFAKFRDLGVETESLLMAIGPGIRQCHFEVGKDLLNKFPDFQKFAIERGGNFFVDLPKMKSEQFVSFGGRMENVEDVNECTYCLPEKYLSHRREKESNSRMLAYIGLE